MKNKFKYFKFSIALSLFFFGSLFSYIPIFIFNLDPNNLSITNYVSINLFSNIICFSILVLMYRKDILKGMKDLKEKKFKPLLLGLDYWFIALMVMAFSTVTISLINNGGTSTNEESVRIMLNASPILTALSITILSPVIEELVFRKSFRDIFKDKWIYIATSGLIFGALHVLLSPINSIIDYLYLIPYCSMGVAFSYMYFKTDNIIVSITMHIFHNLLNLISTLFFIGVII